MADSSSLAGISGLFREFWQHLSPRRRRHYRWTFALMVVSAFAEVVSLGAVLPFLGILTAPERVLASPTGGALARAVGIHEPEGLVLPLTVLFVLIAVGAAAVRTTLLYVSTRVAFASGTELGHEIFRRTLYQPYSTHISRNTSEVISGIINKIHDVVFGVLMPMMVLASALVLLVVVTVALVFIDPAVALGTMGAFGGLYGVIVLFSKRKLRENSVRIAEQQTQVMKTLQEGLGSIRDVLLDGSQPQHSEAYRRADRRLRMAQASNAFMAQGPRFAMESLGMIALAVLAFILHRRDGGVTAALPLLGALAFGAQRLLPSLQQAHTSISSILGYQSTLRESLRLLDQPVAEALMPDVTAVSPMPFRESIQLDGVRFRYGPESAWVLDGVNLRLRKGSRVGFVGATGSGKSTVLDVIMGLLTPTEGALRIDGEEIGGPRVRAWQRAIAHVPQNIYLSDGTIAENIAFGRGDAGIDMQRVRLAAERAQISGFIESRHGGYDALVGERGVKLSGGQRQRIGLARALYRDASVLVLDEATSALDSATESAVMAALESLQDVTIVMIAHRLSTVEHCDLIVELDHGRVVAQGTYNELLERSPSFRLLARSRDNEESAVKTHVQ